MNHIILIIFSSIIVQLTSGVFQDFVFDFGNPNRDDIVYQTHGSIKLHRLTVLDMPIPDNIFVTHVKVVVNALAPPKVDFRPNAVIIAYSWVQIPASSYDIQVQGIVNKPCC